MSYKSAIYKLPSEISVRRDLKGTLRQLAERVFADGVWATELRCRRCDLIWKFDGNLADVMTQTCSNCYSDRLAITKVKFEFHDWGEQNGGAAEMKERYEAARIILSRKEIAI